jgi:hypothetical protein
MGRSLVLASWPYTRTVRARLKCHRVRKVEMTRLGGGDDERDGVLQMTGRGADVSLCVKSERSVTSGQERYRPVGGVDRHLRRVSGPNLLEGL